MDARVIEDLLGQVLRDAKTMQPLVSTLNENDVLMNYVYEGNELRIITEMKNFAEVTDSDVIGFICFRQFAQGPMRFLMDALLDLNSKDREVLAKEGFPTQLYVQLGRKFYKMMSTGLNQRLYRQMSMPFRKEIKKFQVGEFLTLTLFYMNNHFISPDVEFSEDRWRKALKEKNYSMLFVDAMLFMTNGDVRLQRLTNTVKEAGCWDSFRYDFSRMYRAAFVTLCEAGRGKPVTGMRDSEAEQICETLVQEERDKVAQERIEYAELLRAKDQEIAALRKQVQEFQALKDEIDELRALVIARSQRLQGMKVLVVGDTGRAAAYKAIVEGQGGIFDFLDGIDDCAKVCKAAEKADLVFFFTGFCKHTAYWQLKKSGAHTININTSGGEESLRNAILNMDAQKVV